MIAALIRWSIGHRLLVVLGALVVVAAGLLSLRGMQVDALPDLSDTQVIIRASFSGQAPQLVEDQVTFPLTTAMQSVPGTASVRGLSMYGDSFIYVLFKDGTDPYWARSRVSEALTQIQGRLPADVHVELGPDATGVDWIYEYALVDRSGKLGPDDLRALQDWTLKYQLKAVPGVAEVATVGGMVRQYQVVVDPNRLNGLGLMLSMVKDAIRDANKEAGGSVIEMSEADYMVRTTGYLQSIEDLQNIPLGTSDLTDTPLKLGDVADIRIGPEARRGLAELDGQGEVTGGIVVMSAGANALRTIAAVKARLAELKASLPDSVEVVETYDRSTLIHQAIATLDRRLIEEFIIVTLVCLLFLAHLRSALIVVLTLPIAILIALLLMRLQGITANVMSLGGIAIAVGVMVDAGLVMVENVHRHLAVGGVTGEARRRIIAAAAAEVGSPLFFSLLIIAVSFIPVFALEAQEGRLFAPLAYTKTYAVAAAAGLSVTLIPALMAYLIRGRVRAEQANPLDRLLVRSYRPLISLVLQRPWLVLAAALLVTVSALWPLSRLGAEFMPELDEGDLVYMPTVAPGVSIEKMRELLQQTDRLIRATPEVRSVFGKAGRADTATDPAPLEMIESTIQFKPRGQWRPGMTPEKLRAELDARLRLPGVSNTWVMPIQNRLNMQATGIKTPIGVKVTGPDAETNERLALDIERVLRTLPGTQSTSTERTNLGRYVQIAIDRAAAARFALNIADIDEIIDSAIGGANVTETIEGRQRFPVNLRYPPEWRDSLAKLNDLPIVTKSGAQVLLGSIAKISLVDGPTMLRSEDAQLASWVYVNVNASDFAGYVEQARAALRAGVQLPPSYTVIWSGSYEALQRAEARLSILAPAVLLLIVGLLFLAFRRVADVVIILLGLPLALVGGAWLLYALDYRLSVASAVGFIALAGVAAETGVVMLIYLNQAFARHGERAAAKHDSLNEDHLRDAVIEGAVLRVRPKIMTVTAILAGLLPVMIGGGTGSEVMRRIAAPMVGGIISATFLTLVVVPALFFVWKRAQIRGPVGLVNRYRGTRLVAWTSTAEPGSERR